MDNLVKQGIYETGRRYALTMREIECLSYLTTGKSAKEIARLINISPRTVETHISNIRLKTRCQTKTEMTVWFKETFKPFLGKSSTF
ncbi:MAG: helix-turn-helix transcriptional regulator [Alphaproteobacteria bacterium]|nr:helix-turn-helix transcriptional regulator [Alphaproteobacteria bacterium]